jgi:hypothetical protein
MAITLRLNRQQHNDLQAICRLDLPTIEQVVATVDALPTSPLHPEQVKEALQGVAGDRSEELQALLRLTISFINLQRNVGLSAAEVVELLGNRIPEKGYGWDAGGQDQWKERQSIFLRLLEHPRFRTVAKALELSYDYMNLLEAARIVTDVRPVYDETAARVEGLIVSFTLRLLFDSADGSHSLSIAMDEKDVSTLEEQCQRALIKAKTAVTAIAIPTGLPAKITGAKNNGPGTSS